MNASQVLQLTNLQIYRKRSHHSCIVRTQLETLPIPLQVAILYKLLLLRCCQQEIDCMMTSREKYNDSDLEDGEARSHDSDDSDRAADDLAATTTDGCPVPSKRSRLDRRRESNRLSKRKCRMQRKETMENLEAQIRQLTQEQQELKQENDELRKELLEHALALQTNPSEGDSSGCNSRSMALFPGKSHTGASITLSNPIPPQLPYASRAGENNSMIWSNSVANHVANTNALSPLATPVLGHASSAIFATQPQPSSARAGLPSGGTSGINNNIDILNLMQFFTNSSPSCAQDPLWSYCQSITQADSPQLSAYLTSSLQQDHAASYRLAEPCVQQPLFDQQFASALGILPSSLFTKSPNDVGLASIASGASAMNSSDVGQQGNAASHANLSFPSEFCQGSNPQSNSDLDRKLPAQP